MISFEALLRKLPQLPTERYEGFLYRRISLAAYQSVRPSRFLYAFGAAKHGARFTPRDGPPCLYASENKATAEAEFHQSTFACFQNQASPPSIDFALRTLLKTVLHLTRGEILVELQTTAEELNMPWRMQEDQTPSQILGKAVNDCRITAIKYPSTRKPGGICFAIFTEALADGSYVELWDPEKNFCERIPS